MEIVAIALMAIILIVASAMVNGTKHDPIKWHDTDEDPCLTCRKEKTDAAN